MPKRFSTVPGREFGERIRMIIERAGCSQRRIAELLGWHPSREFVFFIHEQALRLPVGSPEVMRDQLLHVLRVAERDYVVVRVVPTSFGAHAGLSGSFVQLRYDKYRPVVHTETENSRLFLEEEWSVDTYSDVLKALGRQALDAEQSSELIENILAEA